MGPFTPKRECGTRPARPHAPTHPRTHIRTHTHMNAKGRPDEASGSGIGYERRQPCMRATRPGVWNTATWRTSRHKAADCNLAESKQQTPAVEDDDDDGARSLLPTCVFVIVYAHACNCNIVMYAHARDHVGQTGSTAAVDYVRRTTRYWLVTSTAFTHHRSQTDHIKKYSQHQP